ncbi:MAG: SDR family NAD(P)-dependent oxidoreductase [Dongiaceae bacterium]
MLAVAEGGDPAVVVANPVLCPGVSRFSSGRALARAVLADINVELGNGVVSRFPGRAEFFEGDISCRADMQRLVAATVDRHARIDILLQVAGICPQNIIENISEAEWDRVMAVNLKGPFLAIQACFPIMKRQRYGRIVLTGSITGPLVSWPNHAHYSASKAGLEGLARCAAIEGASHGITVNVVEPGNVDTENVRAAVRRSWYLWLLQHRSEPRLNHRHGHAWLEVVQHCARSKRQP